jgi:hypothetical protein
MKAKIITTLDNFCHLTLSGCLRCSLSFVGHLNLALQEALLSTHTLPTIAKSIFVHFVLKKN